ncbi:hypothetical protein E4U35_005465 [Claviceps purpurea]|nr:hypothetical protein E4U36_005804 [Claviceps purpurea]KAG6202120.1 hypothetical protein E4U35_005465 [Claviceps purpurea]KAG6237850.1 hypothetical protein E4U25_002339 [Claviceps purpurea]KAG6275199.1 hypothetical protein E4U47_001031 [Claviceps purpurea]
MVNIGKSRYCIHTPRQDVILLGALYICCSKQNVADGRGLMAAIGNSASEDEPNETPRHSYDAAQGYGASV